MGRFLFSTLLPFLLLAAINAFPTFSPSTDAELPDLSTRIIRAPHGLQIIPGSCSTAEGIIVQAAIHDASALSAAALTATTDPDSLPFRFFFPPDATTANGVAAVYIRVRQAQLEQGPLIRLTCFDIDHRCRQPVGNITHGPLAYITEFAYEHRLPAIVLCPSGLALKRSPASCSRAPGEVSLGWLMLYLVSQLSVISGPTAIARDEPVLTAGGVGKIAAGGGNTTGIASAYAWLGSWSWDLGFVRNRTGECMGRFWRGNFEVRVGDGQVDRGSG